MPGHTCHHCKQWVEEGEAHDCWTTTETALTEDLTDDLREAWERLRETAVEFGDQRIYASHSSIMFSRRACYFFVRPKRRYLEVVVFLGREITAPQVHRVLEASRTKRAHVFRIEHRDQVEAPLTDWLREAYDYVEAPRPLEDPARRKAPARSGTAGEKPTRATTRQATPPKGAGTRARPSSTRASSRLSGAGTAVRGRGTRRR